MDKGLKAIVTLTASDLMSSVFRSAIGNATASLDQLKRKQNELKENMSGGGGMIAAGVGVAMAMAPAVKAFAELQDSSAALESVMMKAGGKTSQHFQEINDLAGRLGDKLPGTTAELQNMMATLIRSGVEEKSIIEGVGEAAANLGVVLKLPYEEAARMAAKLKEATGVSNQEMLGFMDTIARVSNLGVSASEMQYAFGRSAGTLKLLKLQGLDASKAVANVYAQLIKAGASGETVGTNMASVFNAFYDEKKMGKLNDAAAQFGMHFDFVDKKTGQFKGVQNMIAQFEQLKTLNASQQASVVQAFLGPGQDASFMNTLINNGVKGFEDMNDRMKEQADLEAKVGKQLGTLASAWESATGTITNMMAAIGAAIGPELTAMSKLLGEAAAGVKKFAAAFPSLFKLIGVIMGLTSAFLVIAGVVKVVTAAWGLLNITMMMNPWIATVAAIIAAAAVIYVYWDKIKAFFIGFWEWLKGWGKWLFLPFAPLITVVTLIIQHWSKIAPFFSALWSGIVGVFKAAWGLVVAVFRTAFNLIVGILVNFTPVGLIYKHWDGISAFFGKVWEGAKAEFNKILVWVESFADKFFGAGAKIVQMIADGIKSKINEATKAIEGVATKVREYLPFSPAKTGPFKTLHQLKFTETLAQSIKPGPAVKAMNNVAAAVVAKAASPKAAGALANIGGGSTVVHFSPTINAGAGVNATDLASQLKDLIPTLVNLIEREQQKRSRARFA